MTAKEGFCEKKGKEGHLSLSVPGLLRLTESGIRFFLAAVLAGAEIFGGYAPFGLSMVAVSGAGSGGLFALLGAAFGYLCFRGLVEGLRYVAAAVLIFAVSFAFSDLSVCRKGWFMPLCAAAINGSVGFVYLSENGWRAEDVVFFATELLLTAGGAVFYRLAFSAWERPAEDGPLSAPQSAGALALGATLLMTLARFTVLDTLSLGRVCAAYAVMICAWQGGVGPGTAAGAAGGLAMDLASGAPPYYTAAFALAGLVCGVFRKQGKAMAVLGYVLADGAMALWCWETAQVSLLYEVFAASVLLMITPDKLVERMTSPFRREDAAEPHIRARTYAARHLRDSARSFRAVSDSLRGAFRGPEPNDGDASAVFRRAADRVCAGCPQHPRCWSRDFNATQTALNDALPALLDRGEGIRSDFPSYFADRCVKFPAFLAACNQEVTGFLCRRQYDSRVRESRAAVCEQYGQLAEVLEEAASACSAGVEELAARKDSPAPLRAVAGVASASKSGQTVSGDAGSWFKDDEGVLHILLCDGMGSGAEARRESDNAAGLLEQFLKAGVKPAPALKILGEALALRGEARGGFTTVDLLRLDLFTGEGAVYKLGGAPTYVRRGGTVTKLAGSSLPAGMTSGGGDALPLRLSPGDWVVMASDGISADSDQWLRDALASYEGSSPQELARALLEQSGKLRCSGDDKTVVALRVLSQRQRAV